MANPTDGQDIDFPLGNPRSHLRRDLDAHAGYVTRRHSLWVDDEDDNPSALPRRHRHQHFSVGNALENAAIVSTLTNPASLLAASLTDPRFRRVIKALRDASHSAGSILGGQTSKVLQGVLASVMPTLLEMAEVAAGGAVVGIIAGAIGGGGVGDEVTIPAGAVAGMEAALALYGYYGLGQMLKEGGVHLGEFARLMYEATALALYAGENQGFTGSSRGFTYEQDMRDASLLYAAALGELWWLLLQAIVAYVLKKAAEIAGPAASKALRSEAVQTALGSVREKVSQLGNTFYQYLEGNFEGIKRSVEEHRKAVEGGDSGSGGGETPPASQDPKGPKPEETTASKLENSEFNGVKADRVRPGTNGKVAVVGRSMGRAVNPYAEGLASQGYDVETFSGSNISQSALDQWDDLRTKYQVIPDDVLQKSLMYQENEAWANKLASEGYTVVDVDNPTGQSPSIFYEMEQQVLFGSGDTTGGK